MLMIDFFNEKNRHPLNHSLGFHSCPTQTSFESLSSWSKKYCHVGILESNGLWTLASSVKGREAEFLVSCNLIGGNRQPLDRQP
jgi:hypothetical protein